MLRLKHQQRLKLEARHFVLKPVNNTKTVHWFGIKRPRSGGRKSINFVFFLNWITPVQKFESGTHLFRTAIRLDYHWYGSRKVSSAIGAGSSLK